MLCEDGLHQAFPAGEPGRPQSISGHFLQVSSSSPMYLAGWAWSCQSLCILGSTTRCGACLCGRGRGSQAAGSSPAAARATLLLAAASASSCWAITRGNVWLQNRYSFKSESLTAQCCHYRKHKAERPVCAAERIRRPNAPSSVQQSADLQQITRQSYTYRKSSSAMQLSN